MNPTQVRNQIVRVLYQAFFLSRERINLAGLLEQEGWERRSFENLLDRMEEGHLIEPMGMGGFYYQLTAAGVIYGERAGIVDEELAKTNERARTQVLLALAEVYEEQGNLYMVQNSKLYQRTGLDEIQATANLTVMLDLGFAESFGNAGSKITSQGLDAVEQYKKKKAIADEFEIVSAKDPHPRGRALQKLIAKLIESHGWGQDEGVRTSNEEMDIIVFREREYYLLESKWEKDPIEAAAIRELFGKLGNRIDVRGIVASMSGFSEGSIKQVHDYTGQRIILLFGPEDIRAMVYGEALFDDLLNAKYKELVTKRKVAFS